MTSNPHTTTAPAGIAIDFFVDNEPVMTELATLTVAEILRLSQNAPVEDYFLIEFKGQSNQQVRHEDLNEAIHVHPQQRFAAVFRGPTPVS
ncbi:MAG: hypothetical protein KJ057_13105 [Phycisphaerae bacterium]|nr:hypothetical protein [Planctomycetia bacterium]MCL4719403.1 hypothetical protein [Phycisphaerae bacterium]